jgi:signal transduction histidine kinase
MRDFRKNQADLERIRAELEEKNKKLKQKDEMRLLFLASATHDLKSPLNTITSYIQSMVDGYMGNITDEQRRVLQRILNRINGLRQLISDILILGEFESGEEKEVKSERFDIIQLLRESVEEFRPLASERGISLRFESYVERAYVKADPLKIDEVIHNYISNAIKYNRDNGSVMVRAELKGGFVEVSVADTGIGLKEEDLKRLFTDFFRASEVKKNKIEGTGLGLAIVKRIIERYGGYVWAESRYNEGSTFYFKLPVDSSEEGGAGASAG